jgi:alpha-N-arabinofuranosidase
MVKSILGKAFHLPRLFLLMIIWLFISNNFTFANNNQVTVFFNKDIGPVNKNLFGNNLVGYDPVPCGFQKEPYFGHSDFGAGIWDPIKRQPIKEVIELVKESGISILRFPGGCGSHHYDWKKAIGSGREHFLFGIDEFMKICEDLDIEPIFTVSFFIGDEDDAADLVEYLNAKNDGTNINGGIDWAAIRAKNGHPTAYNVKYFEIGNEVYHGDHQNVKKITAEQYVGRYLQYYLKMKKVNPQIKIGAILHDKSWNNTVLSELKDKIDFGIVHYYPGPGISDLEVKLLKPSHIFSLALVKADIEKNIYFEEIIESLITNSKKDLSIAITEYNGWFEQIKEQPYRHSLGNALLVGELLENFMYANFKILMANYWNFVNEYWGMVANGFDGNYETLRNPYYKRPNFYVFEFYNNHFGDILLDVDVKCDVYDVSGFQPIKTLITKIKKGTVFKINLLRVKWEIREITGINAEEKEGILEINFIEPKQFNYYHSIKRTQVEPNTFYKLSGYIKTENFNAEPGVCLEVQDDRGWNATHSAVATDKITGTSDWKHVEVIYDTLPDTKSVNVIARRIGDKGPLKGKVYFKDVKLEKFVPSVNTKIPYLSVNASRSSDGNKIYLMVINRNLEESITSNIDLKDFILAKEGNAWILNGPHIDATNEKNHNNVKISHKRFKIEDNPFDFTFEPHSLTAIEIERKVK